MPTPANGNASEKFPLPTTAVPPPLLLLVTPCAPISDLSLLAFHRLRLRRRPARLTVIGAGAIGVEFAYFFNAFGTEVTIVEMLPNVLPVEDTDVSLALEKSLKRQGIKIFTNTRVVKAEVSDIGVRVTIEGKKQETLEGDCVLVAVGVAALLPKGIELKLDKKGYIAVNDRYETSLSGVYAAGDVIGPPWLAHVASWEAIQAVTGMFTDHKPKRLKVYPGCT